MCSSDNGARLVCDVPLLAIGAVAPAVAAGQRPGARRARLRRHLADAAEHVASPRCSPPATSRARNDRALPSAAACSRCAPARRWRSTCGASSGRRRAACRGSRGPLAVPAVVRRAARHRVVGRLVAPRALGLVVEGPDRPRLRRSFARCGLTGGADGRHAAPRPSARTRSLSRGLNSSRIGDGTRPSSSRGSTSVRSIARSTASSHSLLPLRLDQAAPTIVPSARSAPRPRRSGLPAELSVNKMFGLTRAMMRPA